MQLKHSEAAVAEDLTCLQLARFFNTTMIIQTLSAQLRTHDCVPTQEWLFGHMTMQRARFAAPPDSRPNPVSACCFALFDPSQSEAAKRK
jgi:hypothetical protein